MGLKMYGHLYCRTMSNRKQKIDQADVTINNGHEFGSFVFCVLLFVL